MSERTTRITRQLAAPASVVYRALIDAEAVKAWRFPDGMSIQVHEFDPRAGGRFRVSLTYHDPSAVGKTMFPLAFAWKTDRIASCSRAGR